MMRIDSPDGNRGNQPPKNRKRARAKVTIQDFVGEGVGHKREKSILRSHHLDIGCWVGAAVTQNIDGSKRKGTVLEACPLIPQSETPFLRTRGEPRERLRRTKELLHRIRPEAYMGTSRHDLEACLTFEEGGHVVRYDAIALPCERGCRCRLSCPFRANEDYTAILQSHCARVKTCHASQSQ